MKFRSCVARHGLLVSVAMWSGGAWAQSSPPATPPAPQATVDETEIIVTAQKRSESVRDVPISISAVSAEQMARAGVAAPDDLQRVVPGFVAKPGRTGAPVYSIRGIGFDDTGIGSSPAVSVSVDQIPLPFLIMTPAATLDLERVEVLKGPQGTLFGQNTTGGAINFIAAKPTATPSMGFALTYGRFNEISANGFVSLPISSTLGIRIAAQHDYRDGWQISDTRTDDRLGRRDFSVGRILLDWTPTSRLRFELNANGFIDKSETQAAQFVAFSPTIPIPPGGLNSFNLVGNRLPTPRQARRADWFPGQSYRKDNKQYQIALRADWNVTDALTLTSLSSFAHLDSDVPTDSSGTNKYIFNIDQIGRIKTFSQEVRGALDIYGIKVTVGVNYQHDKTDDYYGVHYVANNNQIGPFSWNDFIQEARQSVDTYAAFAGADVPITTTLTAQAGIRYTKQNRSFLGCLRDAGDGRLAGAIGLIPTLAGLPYNPAQPGACVSLNADFSRLPIIEDNLNEDNLSWRAGLNWKPMDETLVYGNVTRGFKAGAFTPVPAVFAAQFRPVSQEKVTAYEVGLKQSLLGRKIDLAVAGFHSLYADKQLLGYTVFPPFGALPTLQNVPKSTIWGAEANLTLRPVRGLNLTGGVTYVKTRISQSFTVADPLGRLVDIKGEAFPNAPRWLATGTANYEFSISSSLTASLGGDISYRTKSQASFGNNPAFVYSAYALVGANASIGSADDSWRFEVWGRNITNKYYVVNLFKAGDTVSQFTGLPATYGVTLRTRF